MWALFDRLDDPDRGPPGGGRGLCIRSGTPTGVGQGGSGAVASPGGPGSRSTRGGEVSIVMPLDPLAGVWGA